MFAGVFDAEGVVLDGNQLSIEECGLVRSEEVRRQFWEGGWRVRSDLAVTVNR
jgi:hypothetical protein